MASPFQSMDATAKAAPSGQENEAEKQLQFQQQKKALLEKIATDNQSNPNYVSPSDAIMSPATAKLSSFKQRQMKKNGSDSTRRSLFRSMSANSDQSLGGAK